jgi:hypothetical protein
MTCWERTAATVVECPSRSVTSRGLEEIVAVVQTARSREEAGVDGNDPFSRELRSARDRIAELQRRSRAGTRPGGGLLPEALAELDGAIEELSVTGQELHEQTAELTSTRLALESEPLRPGGLRPAAPPGPIAGKDDQRDGPRGHRQPGPLGACAEVELEASPS